jgi:hypothetical protein
MHKLIPPALKTCEAEYSMFLLQSEHRALCQQSMPLELIGNMLKVLVRKLQT